MYSSVVFSIFIRLCTISTIELQSIFIKKPHTLGEALLLPVGGQLWDPVPYSSPQSPAPGLNPERNSSVIQTEMWVRSVPEGPGQPRLNLSAPPSPPLFVRKQDVGWGEERMPRGGRSGLPVHTTVTVFISGPSHLAPESPSPLDLHRLVLTDLRMELSWLHPPHTGYLRVPPKGGSTCEGCWRKLGSI